MVDAVDLSCYKERAANGKTVEPRNEGQSRNRFSIRAFLPEDIEQVVDICKQQASTSDYSEVKFNAELLRKNVLDYHERQDICMFCAFDSQQKLIGFTAYSAQHYVFSYDIQIADMTSYVIPEYRKSTVYPRLMQCVERWGKKMNAKRMYSAISTGVNIEEIHNMFLRCGYVHLGGVYRKDL
jgi:GNAT superfamily N-acetyltransferase